MQIRRNFDFSCLVQGIMLPGKFNEGRLHEKDEPCYGIKRYYQFLRS